MSDEQGRRVIVTRPGGFQRLALEEFQVPSPGPGQVLVRTRSIGVNFADCVVRMGLYTSARALGFPICPGFEAAGEVLAVGAGVQHVRAGDPVVALSRFGAYTSHLLTSADWVFPLPARLDLERAGALSVMGLTAWYALTQLCHLRPGMNVFVHSAAGGVGTALVQLARIHQCRVFAVVGAEHKAGYVEELGAQRVAVAAREDIWAAARQFAPDGFDVVLDANGPTTLRQSYAALRPTGRLVVYGFHTMLSRGSGRRNWLKLAWTFLQTPRFQPLALVDENRAVLGFNLSTLFERADDAGEAMRQLLDWAARDELRVPRVQSFPLEAAAEAHAALQSGATVGKLVLTP